MRQWLASVASDYVGRLLVIITVVGVGLIAVLMLAAYSAIRPDSWPDRDAVIAGVVVFTAAIIVFNQTREAKWVIGVFRRSPDLPQEPPSPEFVIEGVGPFIGGSDIDINIPEVTGDETRRRGEFRGITFTLKQGRQTIVRDKQGTIVDPATGRSVLRISRAESRKWRDGYAVIQTTPT